MEKELNGISNYDTPKGPIYIQYSDENCPVIPPTYIIESILSLDMCVIYSIDTKLSCFIVSGEEISLWKNKNKLP
jgi:hypothetical protein